MEKIYIAVMHSGTRFSEIVRFFTKSTSYSHVGFAFTKALNPLYSFGRLFYWTPYPGGFVTNGFGTKFYNHYPNGKLVVYSAEVSGAQMAELKEKLSPFVENRKIYRYGYINCIAHMLGKTCHRKRHHTCTSFCGDMLHDILGIKKDSSALTALDFCDLGLTVEYEGLFKNLSIK